MDPLPKPRLFIEIESHLRIQTSIIMADIVDEEKRAPGTTTILPSDSSKDERQITTPTEDYANFFGKLRSYENALDQKFGIESQGPARVLSEERDPSYNNWSNQAVMALMWASATMNLSCFTTGFLGLEFGLDLKQSILIVIFGTFLGSALTAWCATMGPGTGLRQVSISRYSFGWWPSKIIAALNVIEQLGWSSVGCITGGLALSAVSDGHINLALGVVIIALVGLCFSFVGLRAVLTYEKYAWAIFFVIFMIMYGQTASKADAKTKSVLSGESLSAQVLTLLAVVYGSSASWCSIVSDFYVQYPVNTSKTKVFILTALGITIPTCIGMVLGCCVGSTMGINSTWANTYDEDGVGQLIQVILYPLGFAKFLLVILVLSGIGMNCIAIYSAALSIQQFARPLSVVPRFMWTLIVFVGILLIGLAGRNHLLAVLQNFLSLLGYWNTSFFVILFVEHYMFRKGSQGYQLYDLEAWNDPAKMPIGIAGLISFLCGIAGCVLGMVQTWYTGPIAKLISGGGDIGNQLAFAFTLISYIPLRILEWKYIGK